MQPLELGKISDIIMITIKKTIMKSNLFSHWKKMLEMCLRNLDNEIKEIQVCRETKVLSITECWVASGFICSNIWIIDVPDQPMIWTTWGGCWAWAEDIPNKLYGPLSLGARTGGCALYCARFTTTYMTYVILMWQVSARCSAALSCQQEKKTGLVEQEAFARTREKRKRQFMTFGRRGRHLGRVQGCQEVMQIDNHKGESTARTPSGQHSKR